MFNLRVTSIFCYMPFHIMNFYTTWLFESLHVNYLVGFKIHAALNYGL